MRTSSALSAALLLAACAPLAAQDAVDPAQPAFDPAAFATATPNRWFPLEPGQVRTFRGTTPDGEAEVVTVTVQGPGPAILGVPTIAVLDEVETDGLLTETTIDYFAEDRAGNVWYMGEDTTEIEYDDNDVKIGESHAGQWRAGVNGALPGIAFPGEPAVGGPVFSEYAPNDEALDWGQVMATGLALDTAAGSFADVVKVFESSQADPSAREYKYYAPGAGLIREEELGASGDAVTMTSDLQP